MAQPNSQYGNSVYFPYAAGSLVAYAFEDEAVRNEYEIKDFFYKKTDIDSVVKQLDNPFFMGFSCYVWNYEYNRMLAKAVKDAYPDCIISFGGHQVNERSEVVGCDYVDYVTLGEGEESFRQLLLYLAGKTDIESVSNLIYKTADGLKKTQTQNTSIPHRVSPYLKGYFDKMAEEEELEFSAILETNRGCPNKCAFCDWGNIKTKMRCYNMETVKAEIDWFSEKKIEYVYCADGNFGLFERDEEIVEYLIKKHSENGFPQKFQATYSKNNPDTVFRINKRLNEVGMCKGATLSFQSMHQDVLDNIFRKNMPIENFHRLMSLYNANGIAAYSEIILGLPGETYETFKDGIEQLLDYGQHMSINFFNCELLRNSIMSDPEYMKKYDIKFAKTEQHQYHVIPNSKDIPEFSRIVVSTSSLSKERWIDCNILSVFVRAFHNLGLFQCIAIYLYYEKGIRYTDFYEALIEWAKENPDSVCGEIITWLREKYLEVLDNSGSLTCSDPAFGELTWPLDEGAFLKVMKDYGRFFEETDSFLRSYFEGEDEFYAQLLSYQKAVTKTPYSTGTDLTLDYDFYKYFKGVYNNEYEPLEKRRNSLHIDASDIPQNLPDYGKITIWYGRKGGQNIITKINYTE